MKNDEVSALIARRPSVHRLCYGAYLQSPIWISPDDLAVPLKALGFQAELGYLAIYLKQFFGVEIAVDEAWMAQLAEALPVIDIIHFSKESGTPASLEAKACANLERSEQIIVWVTGDRVSEFAYITVNEKDPPLFRMVPPHSQMRRRLGFGNTGDAFQANVDRIRAAADEDPRFAFAMALFADAAHEPNPLFKVCRLFNVLESLAYALKKEPEIGSRRAVKLMLNLTGGAKCNVQVDSQTISYDRIEIAGRLRDKYFHGSPFEERHLIEEAKAAFYLIEHRPDLIAEALQGDCELEFAKWANDTSPAKEAAKARRKD